MPVDEFERRLQALIDGQPLPVLQGDRSDAAPQALELIDAIARVHRLAIFGADPWPDRPVARWGHLEIRAEIGRGASGTVYRAWDPRLAREVALKLIDPSAQSADAALEEGRLLARVNHPHVVRVFGADSVDGAPGIWMELLDGETLEQTLSRDGVFGVEETLLVGLDLARAVSAVHAAGLLHRDIKPRNVLRERGGRIVLTDLGAGRSAETVPPHGDTSGTPLYMAPEVMAGDTASVQSDIYSLGVVLFHLLTGQLPFAADTVSELRAKQRSRARRPLAVVRRDLDAHVAAAIDRACDPRASARYASAAEFEAALSHALATVIRGTPIVSTMRRRFDRWRRVAALTAATATVTALIAASTWDTGAMRAARRRLGWTVGPRSMLYLTANGAIAIVRGRRLTLVAGNPTAASAIAVGSDLGVTTMASLPPWTTGARFDLDGRLMTPPATVNEMCCFYDGTTDGRFNYAARQDSTLLEPVGSRPLARPGLYRFDRDWAQPRLEFPLAADGLYFGVAYDARRDAFWLTRRSHDICAIELWNRNGTLASSPLTIPAALLRGIALDPSDETLWVLAQHFSGPVRLENYDSSGRLLSILGLEGEASDWLAQGAEFAWVTTR